MVRLARHLPHRLRMCAWRRDACGVIIMMIDVVHEEASIVVRSEEVGRAVSICMLLYSRIV
jgi:hypothetical protein